MADGSDNGRERRTQPQPRNKGQGPDGMPVQMQPGMAYFMVPESLFAEVIKVLRKMPYEDVDFVMGGLKGCQPIKSNPEGEEQ